MKPAGYISGVRIEIEEGYPWVVVSKNDLQKSMPISIHATGESAVSHCKMVNSKFKAWWTLNREELNAAEETGEMNPDFQYWVYVWTPETASFTLWEPVETSTMAQIVSRLSASDEATAASPSQDFNYDKLAELVDEQDDS